MDVTPRDEIEARAAGARLRVGALERAYRPGVGVEGRDSLSLSAAETQAHMVREVVLGWSFGASVIAYEGGAEGWHVSATLFPHGRGSTEDDWERVAIVQAAVVRAGAGPYDSIGLEISEQARAQIESGLHPNATHHALWYEGTAAVPPRETLARLLRSVTALNALARAGRGAVASLFEELAAAKRRS